jgi:hypothetical protein
LPLPFEKQVPPVQASLYRGRRESGLTINRTLSWDGAASIVSGEVRPMGAPPRSSRSTCGLYSPLHVVSVGRQLMLRQALGLDRRTGHSLSHHRGGDCPNRRDIGADR